MSLYNSTTYKRLRFLERTIKSFEKSMKYTTNNEVHTALKNSIAIYYKEYDTLRVKGDIS